MKRFVILVTIFWLLLFSVVGTTVHAQISSSTDNHAASEEAEGKIIWEKLQAKQLECKNLTDDNFGSLGEYFMGQMVGSSHEVMNTMMENMMGKVGEEQMHVVMGKRLSGCEPDAEFPQSGIDFMPMMWMMKGGGNPMMGNFGQNPIIILTWVIWLVVGVLLAVWLWKQINKK